MEEIIIGSPRKRKGRNDFDYARTKIKQARLKGQAYVNHCSNPVAAKHPGFHCRCSKKCLQSMGEENCLDIFSKFHNMTSKNEQDLFLQGLIDVIDVQQRRPRDNVDNNGPKTASFKYHVMVGTDRKEVCFNAFLSVCSISEKRVRRIRKLKLMGQTPEDMRGKGITYSLPQEVQYAVSEHIKSFPLKCSHYSGKRMYYLSPELNLKRMWKLFCEANPTLKVSKSFYWKFYRDNFNYRFGRPQVDVCCTCEALKNKIRSPHLNPVAKRAAEAELAVHTRKSKKFYSALQHESSNDAKAETHVLSLVFDYMKTMSLPKMPVQELYYLRQLSVNVFGIHNIKANTTNIYLYHEGVARKGPNEVCSMLYKYLDTVTEGNYTELRLFCDNCSGQNKNQALSRLCLFLTDSGKFKKVTQYFPVRGHSFMPCDRDFGTISKCLKAYDRIYTLNEVSDHIKSSTSRFDKFKVCEILSSDILDFKNWAKVHYKKSCISHETKGKNVPKKDKVYFQISTLFQFVYKTQRKGYIEAFSSINSLIPPSTFFMSKSQAVVQPPTVPAYPSGKVPIKKAKILDIVKMSGYIPDQYKDYYEVIRNWPTTDAELADSDFEPEYSDNEN